MCRIFILAHFSRISWDNSTIRERGKTWKTQTPHSTQAWRHDTPMQPPRITMFLLSPTRATSTRCSWTKLTPHNFNFWRNLTKRAAALVWLFVSSRRIVTSSRWLTWAHASCAAKFTSMNLSQAASTIRAKLQKCSSPNKCSVRFGLRIAYRSRLTAI